MKQSDVDSYFPALKEMAELNKSISPLAAVLLLADYSHPELEKAISKLHSKAIARMNIRFDIVFQLLQNHKFRLNRPDVNDSTFRSMYDKTYCDFNEVKKILGKSKGKVETLISNGRIIPVPNKTGKKRWFIKSEIVQFAQGL